MLWALLGWPLASLVSAAVWSACATTVKRHHVIDNEWYALDLSTRPEAELNH